MNTVHQKVQLPSDLFKQYKPKYLKKNSQEKEPQKLSLSAIIKDTTTKREEQIEKITHKIEGNQ